MDFPINYTDILERIEKFDPVIYGKNRNFINGNISYLSPYISRGVISTRQVVDFLLEKYHFDEIEKFIQELSWREYFQRVWQHLDQDMFEDIRHYNTGIKHRQIPLSILDAATGIQVIDQAVKDLYKDGYLHNHLRMYLASTICNIGKGYWELPSQWMYYHLLDGDIASNICSWQWVAGSFSSKQYYCNQANINKYTNSEQWGTFLDRSYEELQHMNVPDVLEKTASIRLQASLPENKDVTIDPDLPLLIYNSYNMDPLWRKEMKANRILLLEPSHFKEFPVSKKVIDFIVGLSENIQGVQVFTGEINDIPGIRNLSAIFSKEHPAFKHYPGIKDERDWLFPEVKGLYNSFFSFWKNCKQTYKAKTTKLIPELQRA